MSCANFISTPLAKARIAAPCRRSCTRIDGSPAWVISRLTCRVT